MRRGIHKTLLPQHTQFLITLTCRELASCVVRKRTPARVSLCTLSIKHATISLKLVLVSRLLYMAVGGKLRRGEANKKGTLFPPKQFLSATFWHEQGSFLLNDMGGRFWTL